MRRPGHWLACRPLDLAGPLPIICLRTKRRAAIVLTTVVRWLMVRGPVRRSRDPMDRRTAVPEPTEAGVALIGSVVASA